MKIRPQNNPKHWRWQIPIAAIVASIALTITGVSVGQEDEAQKRAAEIVFKKATDLMQQQQFKEAIPSLEQLRKDFPNNHAVLWNLGIAFVETGRHQQAAEIWRSLRKAAPDDWRAISKLAQAYQALGDAKARDDQIKVLYEFRQRSSDPKVKALERFCREQSMIADQHVFGFEYFSPQGPWKKYFLFSIVDDKGNEKFNISLGSYDITTEMSRELGEIAKDQRMYHLDRYEGSTHMTYGFFTERPDYDRVRSMVVDILEGKSKPVSASRP